MVDQTSAASATWQCAFLSTDSLDGFVVDDDLAYTPLLDRGVQVRRVSWRDEQVAWSDFDAVVVRSTWDYQDDPAAFLQTLARIDASGARLSNPLDLIRWNLDKTYLCGLESWARTRSHRVSATGWMTTPFASWKPATPANRG